MSNLPRNAETCNCNPLSPDFVGYPDELPDAVVNYTQPGDRVVYADRWQGTLDTPSAEDLDAIAEYERWLDMLDEIRRDEDHEAEAKARFG